MITRAEVIAENTAAKKRLQMDDERLLAIQQILRYQSAVAAGLGVGK